MTRINTVDPSLLSNKALQGEYFELPRVFTLVRKAVDRGETLQSIRSRQPLRYTLGSGHVIFFCDKLKYLETRFVSIRQEMSRRGMNPVWKPDFSGIHASFYGDWIPDATDIETNLERLRERNALKSTE